MKVKCAHSQTLATLAKLYEPRAYAAIVDGKLQELNYVVTQDSVIEWVLPESTIGKQIYERSLLFLFIVAVKKLFNQASIQVEYTYQDGLYCLIEKDSCLISKEVYQIEQLMKKLVEQKCIIEHKVVSQDEAIKFFKKNNLSDKADLLKYRNKNECSIYTLEGISDYFYGIMLPDTSYLQELSLQFLAPGLWLGRKRVVLKETLLFALMHDFEQWGRLIDVNTVAKLNAAIIAKRGYELMLMSEAMIEKNLAQLAMKIAQEHQQAKLILIAGPSSAGKTTFSKRLAIHLKILGFQPVNISMDDFYLNREDTPKLADGSLDFENIEAIDLKLFNEIMLKLVHQEPVYLPHFDFKTGTRCFENKVTIMKPKQILIIEGIHGLNPRSSYYIPDEYKVKIYINALTHLNYDNHNRIPTTDYRLIRRIVRDYHFRNTTAQETIIRWPGVQAGENKYIYPYQEEADYIFNTSMVYEMAVLKPIAQKLLSEIKFGQAGYLEANRLNSLLDYFVSDDIPVLINSILAEFVGNSIFEKSNEKD